MPLPPQKLPATTMPGQPWTILNYAFRPFFLLGGIFALVAMAGWLAALHGLEWAAAEPDPVLWHAHEMLFGFALGTVAGFLLTAVATWTGRPQVAGPWLGGLVLAWLAGRIAMSPFASAPAGLTAIADMLFPLLLTILAGREILGGRSQRNYGIVAIAAGLALLNLLYHAGRAGVWPGADRSAVLLAVHLVIVLIVIIAGRIVPTFTANWLRMRGATELPVLRRSVEAVVLPLTAAAAVADVMDAGLGVGRTAAGVLAIAAAAVHAWRLAGWRGGAARAEPLLAVLHVAYAWLPIGYFLLGATALGLPLPRSAALHALTMGAIGGVILGVTTRVALGHTGRVLTAAPPTVVAYVLLNAAVLVRILSPLAPGAYRPLIDVAAAGWLAAFGLFLWVYWPVLTRPRIDGRPERRTAAG